MLKPDGFLERGDAPAQAVLRANAEKKIVRQAIETQEELHKIHERVSITLSAYEIGEELDVNNQNDVKDLKNAFVKDDTALEFVDDMATLHFILSDPIAKRKYQQKVTIFVVGYENLCSHRNRLLLQLQEFFSARVAKDYSLTLSGPEFDLDEAENNIRDALSKAEKTTERLANISKDVLKVIEMVNPKEHKRGKKRLEKTLFQSQQDVMHLTEKLVGAQSDLEDTRTKLTALSTQLELKEAETEKLKTQVSISRVFERECTELKKGLVAKEQQVQTYRKRMDEAELSLSQAESKYDEYVELSRNLKVENEHLKSVMESNSEEEVQKIIEIKKDLERKYEKGVSELKVSQEQEIARLKETYEDEILSLKEKLDTMRRRSLNTAGTTASSDSRDSARFSESVLSVWKSSAKTARTSVELKNSDNSRLNTASSEVKEKDSALERSSSIFVSMSDTPVPRTPKSAEALEPSVFARSRQTSRSRETTDAWTQTDGVADELMEDSIDEGSSFQTQEEKSKNDLLETEQETSNSPTNELAQKLDEYRSKFSEIEQQLQEDVLQWKLKFNTKSQALNELKISHAKQLEEKEELLEQLSSLQEQKISAEEEAEKAILELEELRAMKDASLAQEDVRSVHVVQTESRGTVTSASLHRMQTVVAENELTNEEAVDVQSSCTQISCKPSVESPQYSDNVDEQESVQLKDVNVLDSSFGSSNVVHVDAAGPLDTQKSRSPSVVSSGRVRSRLVRSALRDHRVVTETIRTYEMITEFKLNIVVWLQQHGLAHKAELLTAIPDISLNKEDELDVLSKMPAVRDTTQKILDALWQLTKDDYSWPRDDDDVAVVKEEEEMNGEENDVDLREDVVDSPKRDEKRTSSSPLVVDKQPVVDEEVDKEVDKEVEERKCDLQDRPVPSARQSHIARPTPTTPKGYTRLLHEYNNLNEQYNSLTIQLQDNVKSYQAQISKNASVMNEMQETINNLRAQLMDGASGRISTPPSISSLMFTRLDAERNVKSMRRAVHTKRISQDSYNNVIHEMNQYVSLPGRRLANLVKRYSHHCYMKDVEENLKPVCMRGTDVFNLQEKMEYLQHARAVRWSEKAADWSRERNELGEKITSSLKEIEETSGIFLIKPVYSYISRLQGVEKSPSHPVICKKRSPRIPSAPSETSSNPKHPLKSSRSTNLTIRQSIDRPVWNSKDSHISPTPTLFDDNRIPRLLAMDVNRFTFRKNLISGSIDVKSGAGGGFLGVREYISVERPFGSSAKPAQVERSQTEATPPLRHSIAVDGRSSSPGSFTSYPALPPITFPSPHQSSAILSENSTSSLSTNSFDETSVR